MSEREKRERRGGGNRSSDPLSKDYKPPALRRVPNMKYAIVKRNHRILQITAPMWSVAKHFRELDEFLMRQ